MKDSRRQFIILGIVFITLGALLGDRPIHAAAPTSSDSSSVTLGIYHPPTVEYGNELNTFNAIVGKKHGIAMIYTAWDQPFTTYAFLVDQINRQMPASDRPILMISMGPVNGRRALGCDKDYNGAVPPSNIIAGACDRYLATFAQQMKSRPERYLMNFAHEMNSIAQPWSPVNFGQPPSVYVQMWRKVKSVFDAQGVKNVEWVWSPIYHSNPNTPENNPNAYYPGNEYVDWIGVSGYNFYDQMPGAPQPWNSFHQIFDAILRDFACRYPKPQLINEFGTVDRNDGVSKANWILDAYARIPKYPFLRAVIWYNYVDTTNPNADFRITSNTTYNGGVSALPTGSGAWTNAYKTAIAPSVYVKPLPSLQAATPTSTYCGDISTPPPPNPNVTPRAWIPAVTR